MKKLQILGLCFMLVLTSCNLDQVEDDATGTISEQPLSNPTQSTNSVELSRFTMPTTTYIDSNVGFTFEYPADWFVTDPPPPDAIGYAISIMSYDYRNLPPEQQTEGNFLQNETKFEIYVDLSGSLTSIEATLEAIAQPIEGIDPEYQPKILEQTETNMPYGERAVILRGISLYGDAYQNLITLINGYVIQVVVYGDDSLFEEFIATFRPIS